MNPLNSLFIHPNQFLIIYWSIRHSTIEIFTYKCFLIIFYSPLSLIKLLNVCTYVLHIILNSFATIRRIPSYFYSIYIKTIILFYLMDEESGKSEPSHKCIKSCPVAARIYGHILLLNKTF